MTKVSPFISALPRSSSASSDSEEEPIVEQGVRPASLARRPRVGRLGSRILTPAAGRPRRVQSLYDSLAPTEAQRVISRASDAAVCAWEGCVNCGDTGPRFQAR
jgi:hypothetical protein